MWNVAENGTDPQLIGIIPPQESSKQATFVLKKNILFEGDKTTWSPKIRASSIANTEFKAPLPNLPQNTIRPV